MREGTTKTNDYALPSTNATPHLSTHTTDTPARQSRCRAGHSRREARGWLHVHFRDINQLGFVGKADCDFLFDKFFEYYFGFMITINLSGVYDIINQHKMLFNMIYNFLGGYMYDVIIIGAGPAGLTAALYAGRAKLNTLVIGFGATGGQLASTSDIENFPGASDNPSGAALTERLEQQALKFGMKKITAQVTGLIIDGTRRGVQTDTERYFAKTIIIASGAAPRSLNCPGEKELYGMGVSFCAVCDAAFYEGATDVVVVGGGDAAVEEAIYLSKFAEKVTVVHRRDELRAAKSIQDKAFANAKINFVWNSVVATINGNGMVETVTLKNVKTNELTVHATEGVFLYVGMDPNTSFAKGLVTLNKSGYIEAGESTATNILGVFAAGDCRVKILRQVVTAAADGAVAAIMAEKYIAGHE